MLFVLVHVAMLFGGAALKPGYSAMSQLLLFALMGTQPLHDWRGLLQRLAEWLVYGALCIAAWRLASPASALIRE